MSSEPIPFPVPPRTGHAPETVPASAVRPRRRGIYLALAVILLSLLGYGFWRAFVPGTEQANTSGQGPGASLRTASVFSGGFKHTIRLTGVTAAEQYVSLIAPQLRGGRGSVAMAMMGGQGGRSSGSGGSSGGGRSSDSGRSGGGSSSSGSSNSSTTGGTVGQQGTSGIGAADSSGGAGAASGIGSGAMGSGSSGGGFRGSSTNRFGGGSAAPRPSSSTAPATGSLGSSGLGSTSGSLPGGGGGGGGGGGNEFMLVIQELAKPGSMVKKGEVVAEFDRQSMLNRLDDFRASVQQEEASFKKLQAELLVTRKAHEQTILSAKAQLEKARLDMQTAPVRSDIEKEWLRLALEEAEARYKQLLAEVPHVRIAEQAQVKVQEIELQTSRIELKRVEANADRMLVKAPIEGLTVMQNMFRGTEMTPIQQGDQVFPGMNFMRIVNPASMVINANVNQTDVEQMRVGAKATVRFDAYPDMVAPARVISIGAIPKAGGTRASYVKEIPILLKLEKMDPRIIPDLSVSVDVVLASEEKATLAPLAGLFRDEDGSFVFVRDGKDWERRPVEAGPSNYLVAVIRSGLRPGETIAASRPPDDPKKTD